MNIGRKHLRRYVAGCGTRKSGYVYMYTDMQKWLRTYPLSYFLYDPPVLVSNPGDWGLSAQGISYVEKGGVTHAMDWIGKENYPNTADILEELLQFDGSGLIPLSPGITKLIPGKSRRLLFHPRGYLHNAGIYREHFQETDRPVCILSPDDYRRSMHLDHDANQMCAGLHWQDVLGLSPEPDSRLGVRRNGDTIYRAAGPIIGEPPQYDLALVAWLPIDELHIVEGDEGRNDSKIAKAIEVLSRISNLPVFLTNA